MTDKKTLTRGDLAKLLQAELGTMAEAANFVHVFFDTLEDQIAANDEVKIHGFGNFRCLDKAPRAGRNIATGEAVKISARRVASFVASGRLRQQMREDDDSR